MSDTQRKILSMTFVALATFFRFIALICGSAIGLAIGSGPFAKASYKASRSWMKATEGLYDFPVPDVPPGAVKLAEDSKAA